MLISEPSEKWSLHNGVPKILCFLRGLNATANLHPGLWRNGEPRWLRGFQDCGSSFIRRMQIKASETICGRSWILLWDEPVNSTRGKSWGRRFLRGLWRCKQEAFSNLASGFFFLSSEPPPVPHDSSAARDAVPPLTPSPSLTLLPSPFHLNLI